MTCRIFTRCIITFTYYATTVLLNCYMRGLTSNMSMCFVSRAHKMTPFLYKMYWCLYVEIVCGCMHMQGHICLC